ncbi:hypothetical protein BEL04_06210 [Mucilaginibacter sp. PPCGB 2223]|uniref:universal stress protein n=1 Tax=Mucilaginibacter sp. PPCGB 2223 TaxID=1886027 RepID=UPI0008566A34|nr:universal stress protein [Mucilaginibacter sp. PPCGB 2223]OCX53876.1 hypothetical protein BEL04_06210 [Mucilaginibacter sp. PPCGB 2223]
MKRNIEMETLVVFTDFTLKAENTALYALALASHMKADIVLCHVLQAVTPQNKYGEENENERTGAAEDMDELLQRLRRRAMTLGTDRYKPMIACCIKTGTLSSALRKIADTENVLMAVLSARCTDKLTSLLLGSNTRELIDHAQYPVLLIPYEARFDGFKNLVFATDLSDGSVSALNSLCDMAKYFDSEIIITHISDRGLLAHNNTVLEKYFDRVDAEITYPKKRFKIIKDTNILRGLKTIPQKLNADILAMVHRKRNYLQRLFNKSVSHAMVNYPVGPMIIFPAVNIREPLLFFSSNPTHV